MIDQDLMQHIVELNTAAGEKVFMGNAPQGVKPPYVVIGLSAGQQPGTLSGVGLFRRAQFEVSVIAADYPDAKPTAELIRTSLRNFRGLLGGTGGTQVQSCRCISDPIPQESVDGDFVRRWLLASYLFVYSEA